MKNRFSISCGFIALILLVSIASLQEVTALYSGTPSQYWDEEWTQLVGTGNNVITSKISPGANETIYAIGQSTNGTATFRYLTKINGSGIVMWSIERDISQFAAYDLVYDAVSNHIFVLYYDYSNGWNNTVQLSVFDADGAEITSFKLLNNDTFNGGQLCLGGANALYAIVANGSASALHLFRIDLSTLTIAKSGVVVTYVPNLLSVLDLIYVPLTDDLYAFCSRAAGYLITNIYKIDCDTFSTQTEILGALNPVKNPYVLCAASYGDRIYLFGRNNSSPYNHFLSVLDLNLLPVFTTMFQEQNAVIGTSMFLLDNASSVLIIGSLFYSAYDVKDIYQTGLAILYKRYSDPDTFRLESTVAFNRQGSTIDIRDSCITVNGTLYMCGYGDGLVSGNRNGFVLKYPKFVDRMQGKMTVNVLAPPETDENLLERILNQDWEVVGVIALIAFILGALLFRRSSKSKSLK